MAAPPGPARARLSSAQGTVGHGGNHHLTGRRVTVLAWTLLTLLTAHAVWGTLRHDYRDSTLVGDQASQLLGAVSLAHGGNLTFDADDLRHYANATWRVRYQRPVGVFFQRHDHGWAFAKPYGYSAYLSVYLRLLEPTRGVAVANSVLLVALVVLAAALLRLGFSGPAVPLVTAAFVLASNVVPYAYVLYVELFTALLVGACCYCLLRGMRGGGFVWLVIGFGLFGFLVAEKTTLLIALAPLAAVALRRRSWRQRGLIVAAGLAALGLATIPYLVASNGRSYTAYGGERYVSTSGLVPFSQPPAASGYASHDFAETLTLSYVGDQLRTDWPTKARAAVTYLIGRHTGVLVFMPVVAVVIALALARGRRLDATAAAALLGLVAYAVTYVVLFSDNYYGGAQSLGNRYFLQVSPLVLAVAVAARIPARSLLVGALVAGIVGTAVLWPHLEHPSDAVERIDRTSVLQQVFPFERDQTGAIRFACGVTTPEARRQRCDRKYRASH